MAANSENELRSAGRASSVGTTTPSEEAPHAEHEEQRGRCNDADIKTADERSEDEDDESGEHCKGPSRPDRDKPAECEDDGCDDCGRAFDACVA